MNYLTQAQGARMRTAQLCLATQNLRTARMHKALSQNKADSQDTEGLMVTEGHSDGRTVRTATGAAVCIAQVGETVHWESQNKEWRRSAPV